MSPPEQQNKDFSVRSLEDSFQFAVHPEVLQQTILLIEVSSAIKRLAFTAFGLDWFCFGVRNDGHLPKPGG